MTCKGHHFFFASFPSRRALNLGILRDPGSEVEDRQYQLDLQSINIGTAQWEQLKPEKEGIKGGVLAESERSSQNPALEWNMASRSEFACLVDGAVCLIHVNYTKVSVKILAAGVFSFGFELWFIFGLLYLDIQSAPPSFGSLSWQTQKFWLAVEPNTAIMWSV